MEENYIIDLENVTVRFNMATEKIDNLKEYFVKLVKRQLMFEEFLALKNITPSRYDRARRGDWSEQTEQENPPC